MSIKDINNVYVIKMKDRQKIFQIILAIIAIFNLIRLPIPYNVKFDKSMAEELLKETYMPLEDFVRNGIPTENEELLLVSDDIKDEKDFIKLFNNKIDSRVVEDFFEDLIIEKEGRLYIDKKVYIPLYIQKRVYLQNPI